jgi:ribonuclease P protein component
MPRAAKLAPVSASRSQVLRGDKRIAWFLAEKRSLRRIKASSGRSILVQAAWATEARPTHPGLSFWFVASKREIKEAHERNTLKRWMREAIRKSEDFRRIASNSRRNKVRTYLMLRVRTRPGIEANWNSISKEIGEIGAALLAATAPKAPKPPLPLRKKGGIDA